MDKKKVDARLKELEEEINLLSGHLSSAVAGELAGTLKELDSRLDDIRKSIPSDNNKDAVAPITTELKEVRASLDAIAGSLGLGSDKGKSSPLGKRLDDLAGSVSSGVTGIGDLLEKAAKNDAAAIAGLEKTLQGTLNSGVEGIGKKFDQTSASFSSSTDDMKKVLTGAITDLVKKTDGITALLSTGDGNGLGKQIADISETVKKATADLPELPKQVQKQLADLDSGLSKRFDITAAGLDNAKTTLMKDHDELHRSLEIIRRMCTTDEEKYLGSLVTFMHDRIDEIASGLPEITSSVKQKLSVLDKNIQVAAQNNMTKQDEVKKLLLYDITGIGETTAVIRDLCDTGTGTSLGEEAARTGERMERISEDIPEVLSRVNDISSGMEHLAAQVQLMRWFVIAAVGVSLAVLVLSVFM